MRIRTHSRQTVPACAGALLLPMLVMACSKPQVSVPLFDAVHPPLVLTESKEIALPSAETPNRFVKGWWDYASEGPPKLGALAGARIQGVNLSPVSRRLLLENEIDRGRGGIVGVRIAEGEWEEIRLRPKMRIDLPNDLPAGRFSIDFRVPEDAGLGVLKARFNRAQPTGLAETGPHRLLQSGFSLVEVVRRVGRDDTLTGRFRPPPEVEAKQRFTLSVQRGDSAEPEVVFAWDARTGPLDDFPFEIPIGSADGWTKIRFLAQGAGSPARWSDLSVLTRQPETGAAGREAEPPKPPRPPRVVVLYVMDALRSDYVGHLGGPEGISPTIDRLASEGATFKTHFSVAPNTVPSMKSFFTGQVFVLQGGARLTYESGPTLAERFTEAGFKTALFSGNGNVTAWRGMTRGFEHVARSILWRGPSDGDGDGAPATYNNSAERIHDATLTWVDGQPQDEPLFIHIQTIHPHNPYDPPEPFLSRFVEPSGSSSIDGRTRTLKDIRELKRKVSEADQERLRNLYAASVAYNDAHIESFLDALLERYPREEILFLLTSDHGEELFEHDGVLHGYTLYDEMLRIPLVVWWPGTVKPKAIEKGTDNLDVHATLANLTGEAWSGTGRDLWPLLTGKEKGADDDRDLLFASASAVEGGIFMARSPRYKVVLAPRKGSRGSHRWGMGAGRGRGYDAEYRFDLANDPHELTNLAGSRSLEADWLTARLKAWVEAGIRIESGEELGEMDEETRESLRALGYIQ